MQNGTVRGFLHAVDFVGTNGARATGLFVEGTISLRRQPTNNVVERNIVREGEGERGGEIEVSEELWFGDELFRPARNLVARNDAQVINVRHSDRNVVSDNEARAITVSGSLLGGPGGNGVDENVIVGNRVANERAASGI